MEKEHARVHERVHARYLFTREQMDDTEDFNINRRAICIIHDSRRRARASLISPIILILVTALTGDDSLLALMPIDAPSPSSSPSSQHSSL
jgi:hypothetical protein